MRVAFGSAAVAAAIAASAIVALVGRERAGRTGDRERGDHSPRAQDGHAPANEILHVKVVGLQNGARIAGESWQQTVRVPGKSARSTIFRSVGWLTLSSSAT